jgi:hypothetical protein
MVGAMAVLVGLVLVYVGVQALTDRPSADVTTVDYAPVVPAARQAVDFELVAPPRLPEGWRATTASFTGEPDAHWHLGVLTQQGRYVGLEQGDMSVRAMLAGFVDESTTPGGPVEVAQRRWATYTDSGGDLALVRRVGDTTTLVVGHHVPRAELVSYTASLR